MLVPLPDAKGRRQILDIHLRNAREAGLVSLEVDQDLLAEKTEGFSGADLAGLVRSAISFAIADWRETTPTGMKSNAGNEGEGAVVNTGGGVIGTRPTVTASNFDRALSEVQPSVRGKLKNPLRRALSKIVQGG